jgi:integrase
LRLFCCLTPSHRVASNTIILDGTFDGIPLFTEVDTIKPEQNRMLSDIETRKAKPKDTPYKLADQRGLYLLVNPNGGKLWRMNYRFEGKQKTLALGTYPDVPLSQAREKRDEARKLLAGGTDPGEHRKTQKQTALDRAANSFEAVAREWLSKYQSTWVPAHAARIVRRLELDVFPWIGARPMADITAPELLAVLRRIEERGALETAHRTLQTCGQIFRYGMATGRTERDPAADLRGALPPIKGKHFSAITDPREIGALLRALWDYQGSFVIRCALRLAPLVFVRPGELRNAEWSELDLDRAEWYIPAGRMKMKEPHIVPLASQAVTILRELHALTGTGRYVFPSPRTTSRPMSENGVLSALRRMGYGKEEMTGHGFRAMARTVLDEVLGFRVDIIEHQLAHAVKDPNGRAYNRTTYLDERHRMMQAWADYLDGLRNGAGVIPLRRTR